MSIAVIDALRDVKTSKLYYHLADMDDLRNNTVTTSDRLKALIDVVSNASIVDGEIVCDGDVEIIDENRIAKAVEYVNSGKSLFGRVFGRMTVIRDYGHAKVVCQCSCENKTQKLYNRNYLFNERSYPSCGCYLKDKKLNREVGEGTKFEDLTGVKINHWTVIKELGRGKVLCECDCVNHTRREVWKNSLKDERSTSCGCSKYTMPLSIKDCKFGHWTVLEDDGSGRVLCQCDCEKKTTKMLYKTNVWFGKTRSCGCAKADITRVTMLRRYGDIAAGKVGRQGREMWQMAAVQSRENLMDILNDFIGSENRKPTIKNLIKVLDISYGSVRKYIHMYGLEDLVDWGAVSSSGEDELAKYIERITGESTVRNVRNLIEPYEVDIYLPSRKMAIEFNGNYWHCDLEKGVRYHKDKTLASIENGIRLIHIFEYEWDNCKEVVLHLLQNELGVKGPVLDINECNITQIDHERAKKFEEANCIHGYIDSDIRYGILYNGELAGEMTFCASGSSDGEYILARICYFKNLRIDGGSQAMFSRFVNEYRPTSVVAYSDISKFTGSEYEEIGFSRAGTTELGYKWVTKSTGKIICGHSVLDTVLGHDEVDDEAMRNSGYFKIFDCGNAKYIWNKG